MAKPDGYIEASDGGLGVSDLNIPTYVIVDARLPVQPPMWQFGTSIERYKIQAFRQVTMDAGTTFTEIWNGWPSTSSADTVAGAQTAAWVEYDANGQDPAAAVGDEIDTLGFSAGNSIPRHASSASGDAAYLVFESDAPEGEILAVHLAMENEKVFSASVPSSVRDYETIGRNAAVWSPYSKQRSCSAWMTQSSAQNLNKIMFETKQSWTVPL